MSLWLPAPPHRVKHEASQKTEASVSLASGFRQKLRYAPGADARFLETLVPDICATGQTGVVGFLVHLGRG